MKTTLQKILGLTISIVKAFSKKQLSKAWWVRITTENPEYTYYFGPFENRTLASSKLSGFVQDLEEEHAYVSSHSIEWCDPPQPTLEGIHQPT